MRLYFISNSSICVEAVLTSGVAAIFASGIWLSSRPWKIYAFCLGEVISFLNVKTPWLFSEVYTVIPRLTKIIRS